MDSDRIGVRGGSQGGGLTLCTAAMRGEIRAAAAGAPYLTGFMDAIELTSTYPYQEINDYLRLHPSSRERVERTLNYFDCINFADGITCPIIVNIGLQDNVCPPETGYALFRGIASQDKRLYAYDGEGHNAGGGIDMGRSRAISSPVISTKGSPVAESTFPRPDGFDAYWDGVVAELDSTPAEPEFEAIPLRETDFATIERHPPDQRRPVSAVRIPERSER